MCAYETDYLTVIFGNEGQTIGFGPAVSPSSQSELAG